MKTAVLANSIPFLLLGLILHQVPVLAYLRRTKGISNGNRRARGMVDAADKGRSLKILSRMMGKSTPATEAVVEEVDMLNRAETTYAVDEDGDPLYVPLVDTEGNEGDNFFKFDDLEIWDRIDTSSPGAIIDVGAPDEPDETATDEPITDAPVEDDEEDDAGDMEEEFMMEENELEQELEEEDPLIITETPNSNFMETPAQLEARIAELEIQVDTLLLLSETVLELELKLGEAMETIARHERVINTFTTPVDGDVDPPAHIIDVRSASEP